MKLQKLQTSILTTCILLTASTAQAGPLDPPPGPIESTMKTLTEVEPRTVINSTNTPGDSNSAFVITQPGSYYLTQNYTILGFPANVHGIKIAADNVTIDLNGYTLSGSSGALDGIRCESGIFDNIDIKNGTLIGFVNGINLEPLNSNEAIIENVTVKNSDNFGIRIDSGRISNCIAIGNGGNGLQVSKNAIIEGCIVEGNNNGIDAIQACIIQDNIVRSNSLHGINVGLNSIVRDNLVLSNGTATGDRAGINVTGPNSLIQSNVVVNNDIGLQSTSVSIFVQNIVSDNALDINISGANPGLGDEVSSPNGAGAWDNIIP